MAGIWDDILPAIWLWLRLFETTFQSFASGAWLPKDGIWQRGDSPANAGLSGPAFQFRHVQEARHNPAPIRSKTSAPRVQIDAEGLFQVHRPLITI